jgi:hypothetical protein
VQWDPARLHPRSFRIRCPRPAWILRIRKQKRTMPFFLVILSFYQVDKLANIAAFGAKTALIYELSVPIGSLYYER